MREPSLAQVLGVILYIASGDQVGSLLDGNVELSDLAKRPFHRFEGNIYISAIASKFIVDVFASYDIPFLWNPTIPENPCFGDWCSHLSNTYWTIHVVCHASGTLEIRHFHRKLHRM